MNNFETKMLGKPSLSSFVVAKKPRHNWAPGQQEESGFGFVLRFCRLENFH
jgi:hypothetical protein